ncbi:MAG: hypothetical protein L0228_03730 [Planctomycetes bacterium]|nr:hypothetical protein [Planctomycetota bacterium]
MNAESLDELVRDAEQLYARKLKAMLEDSHRDEFVAIEPVSGDYFLCKTLSEAVGAARDAHPDRRSHAMRVGHQAALHFGVHLQ